MSAVPGLPSPAALGALLRQIVGDHEAFDMMRMRAPPAGRESVIAENGLELMACREDTLRELLLTLPAQDLPDCAAQLIAAFSVTLRLRDEDLSREGVDANAARLRRAIASVLLVIARLAGIDLGETIWSGRVEWFEEEFPEAPAPKPAGRT